MIHLISWEELFLLNLLSPGTQFRDDRFLLTAGVHSAPRRRSSTLVLSQDGLLEPPSLLVLLLRLLQKRFNFKF